MSTVKLHLFIYISAFWHVYTVNAKVMKLLRFTFGNFRFGLEIEEDNWCICEGLTLWFLSTPREIPPQWPYRCEPEDIERSACNRMLLQRKKWFGLAILSAWLVERGASFPFPLWLALTVSVQLSKVREKRETAVCKYKSVLRTRRGQIRNSVEWCFCWTVGF